MQLFRVYYTKPDSFSRFISGIEPPDLDRLDRTHTFLRTVEAAGLDDVYHQSQGEVWSPNGEARGLIRAKRLAHTSMSIGDVIEDAAGRFWAVAFAGFTDLGARSEPTERALI
jgi:hypothetical protein